MIYFFIQNNQNISFPGCRVFHSRTFKIGTPSESGFKLLDSYQLNQTLCYSTVRFIIVLKSKYASSIAKNHTQ